MDYHPPVSDILFTLRHITDLAGTASEKDEGGAELFQTIVEEAGRFAKDVIAPLNQEGDRQGATLKGGAVSLPQGWREAYRAWMQAGWNALSGPEAYGGQGLPLLLNTACLELWNGASLAFGLNPILTLGAIEALVQHGSDLLKERYLAKLVSGEWPATMNLTEPQAGSDLNALRTCAVRHGDGTYRISGQKIFITYGEHDLADNIVHLVLARLPDAPAGTRGISLFLVPKILPDGTRNDLLCTGLEHKLGIHASPTCSMSFGDKGGATGWLIGEENRGLACMFTMMNNARLAVGIQGVAVADRAYQQALAYAKERRQGRAPGAMGEGMSPIVEHPDIARTLLTMKAMTAASRGICYLTAAFLDAAHGGDNAAAAHEHASLLTPVAKAFSSDAGVEVASLGIQVHGGMGYIEETGAAQHLRDARILPIYEGTNGIQAIDLVTRKLPLSEGRTVRAQIAAMRSLVTRILKEGTPAFGQSASRLRGAVEDLDRATSAMLKVLSGNAPEEALAVATPYLRLFGLVQGGIILGHLALAANAAIAAGDADSTHPGRIALCRFFAEHLLVATSGLADTVLYGRTFMADAPLSLAS